MSVQVCAHVCTCLSASESTWGWAAQSLLAEPSPLTPQLPPSPAFLAADLQREPFCGSRPEELRLDAGTCSAVSVHPAGSRTPPPPAARGWGLQHSPRWGLQPPCPRRRGKRDRGSLSAEAADRRERWGGETQPGQRRGRRPRAQRGAGGSGLGVWG